MSIKKYKDTFHTEKEKLKNMPVKKKLGYVFTYYRWHIFIGICILCLAAFLGDIFYQSTKETVLLGFATNDDWRLFETKTVQKDFSRYMSLDSSQRFTYDASLYIELDSSVDYVVGSQGQIAATTANQSLDFLITTEELAGHYAGLLPLKDLSEFLPNDMIQALGDKLVTLKDADGNSKAYAIDLSQSRFMKKAWNNPIYENLTPFYLIITDFAPHPETVTDFVRFAFNL